MFSRFRRKPAEPEPAAPPAQRLVVDAGPRQIPQHLRNGSALRRNPTALRNYETPPKRGMWVYHNGAVGILTDLEPGDVAVVAVVDEVGHNLTRPANTVTGTENVVVRVPAAELRQATVHEIPKARRPTAEHAANLGYLS